MIHAGINLNKTHCISCGKEYYCFTAELFSLGSAVVMHAVTSCTRNCFQCDILSIIKSF